MINFRYLCEKEYLELRHRKYNPLALQLAETLKIHKGILLFHFYFSTSIFCIYFQFHPFRISVWWKEVCSRHRFGNFTQRASFHYSFAFYSWKFVLCQSSHKLRTLVALACFNFILLGKRKVSERLGFVTFGILTKSISNTYIHQITKTEYLSKSSFFAD